MTETPKKRAWFQLHLSTCVVLMASIGLIGVTNTFDKKMILDQKPSWDIEFSSDKKRMYEYSYNWDGECYEVGWPFKFARAQEVTLYMTNFETHDAKNEKILKWTVDKLMLAADIACWIIFVGAVGVLCESIIRLRNGKRQTEDPVP